MAISSTDSGEYLDIKVFLYKYTPNFTFSNEQIDPLEVASQFGGKETVEGTFQVTKYSIDLNAPKYFSKFDITQYTKNYQFRQGLYGNTYDWNINFQDAIIPFGQLAPNGTSTVRKAVSFRGPKGTANETVPVLGPSCRTVGFVGPIQPGARITGDLVDLMAQYEAESNWPTSFSTEVSTITAAYLSRGTVATPYASNSQGDSNSILNAPGSDITFNNPRLDGLRLSDLVQKYNYISVFVYKSSVSPTQARQATFPNGVVPGVNGSNQVFDPSNEVHLMLLGYKNEFNGFVTGKNFSRVSGQVDQVSVTGHGSLRLFSDTQTLYDPSILAKGLYEASTINAITPSAQLDTSAEAVQQYFTVFQNLYQGKDPIEILTSLLFMVYRISFNGPKTAPFVLASSPPLEYQGFYDIYQLVLQQAGSSVSALDIGATTVQNKAGNLMTIAPFLLALVMALRNYDYNLQRELQPTRPSGFGSSANTVLISTIPTPIVNGAPDNQFTPINTSSLSANGFAEEFGGPCVQISAVDKSFQPYFKMLKSGFNNYLSQLKTPSAIMSEVTLFSLLEFYEKPNGRIVLRTPQYNQMNRVDNFGRVDLLGNTVTSNTVPIIQATYSEDGTQLQTQKRGSYSEDLIGGLGGGIIQPSYGNGKLMMQYGFREATAEANPVLAGLARSKSAGTGVALVDSINLTSVDLNNLVHKYLRFLLEFDNAGLRVGTLSLGGSTELEIGKLFFDYTNNKMGYIIDVQKQLVVGGTYTSSVSLKFVRDITDTGTNFRQIPTLEELVTAGTTMVAGASSVPITKFPSVPQPKVTGVTTSQQLFSNLGSGLSASPFSTNS